MEDKINEKTRYQSVVDISFSLVHAIDRTSSTQILRRFCETNQDFVTSFMRFVIDQEKERSAIKIQRAWRRFAKIV